MRRLLLSASRPTYPRMFFFTCVKERGENFQELGLATFYKEKDDVRLFCGMLDGLAFLKMEEVPAGMVHLRQIMPNEDRLQDIVDYFDATYASGITRPIQRPGAEQATTIRLRHYPPLYPLAKWNVHDATFLGNSRTNNICEGLNNALRHLVEHNHPSVWTFIDVMQMDQAMASNAKRTG